MTCASCQMGLPTAAEIRRCRAILCHFCMWAEHTSDGPWTGKAVLCTVSGRPVAEHIQSCQPSCPKGKHPDHRGRVWWGWTEWIGAPRFLRWLVVLSGRVPGCGCWARGKLWQRRIQRKIGKGAGHGVQRDRQPG